VTDPGAGGVRHLFTVDVEEYFQVTAFETKVRRVEWDRLPSRLADSMDCLLDLLAERETKATFFVLGWIADRHPDLVRRIAEIGHEVASHGWWHRRVSRVKVHDFRDDVRRSKALLEDLTGRPVYGYRAPRFSIVRGTEWAFDVLIEEGYLYDSSVFPVSGFGYGNRGAPTGAHTLRRETGNLLELPPATTNFAGLRLPAGGGAYLRQLPYGLVAKALREHQERSEPAVIYVHPWELDPRQPRLRVSPLSRLRHYRGLDKMLPRIRRLLAEFAFTSVERAHNLRVCRPVDSHHSVGQ